MKHIIKYPDKCAEKPIGWVKVGFWVLGALFVLLFMPVVLAAGYFVTVLCIVGIPIVGLTLLLASFAPAPAHERWGTQLKAVEDLQPNIIVIENYLQKKNNRQDVFLAS